MSSPTEMKMACRLCCKPLGPQEAAILKLDTAFDSDVETYRAYRAAMILVTDAIGKMADDFTDLEFDDEREADFFGEATQALDMLDHAIEIRKAWFESRVTTTEGGAP